MKATYDAYSKSFLAFKAAVVPGLLALLRVWSECFPKEYKESLVLLLIAILIFSVDLIAIPFASFLNQREINLRLKQIETDLIRLTECSEGVTDAVDKKLIKNKISKLQKEKIDLLGN